MYTIQYLAVNGEHKMQSYETRSRDKLTRHLASFERPVMAVYEQATPVTKRCKDDLKAYRGTLTRNARDFAFRID